MANAGSVIPEALLMSLPVLRCPHLETSANLPPTPATDKKEERVTRVISSTKQPEDFYPAS